MLDYFIESLSEEEHNRLKTEYTERSKFRLHKHTKADKFLLLPMINRCDEKFVNPNEFKWQRRYYKKLFNIENPYINNNLKKCALIILKVLNGHFIIIQPDVLIGAGNINIIMHHY